MVHAQLPVLVDHTMDPSDMIPEELLRFINGNADQHSEHEEAIEHAGGFKKETLPCGVVARTSKLTGLAVIKSCAQCGALQTSTRTLRACARCNGALYCSRQCQKTHWSTHKTTCRPCVLNTGAFTPRALKWLMHMPNVHAQLVRAACDPSGRVYDVPVVCVVGGENKRRAVLFGMDTDTPEKLEALRAEYREHQGMFRVDPVPPAPPFCRVVVVIHYEDTVTVCRMRVNPNSSSSA